MSENADIAIRLGQELLDAGRLDRAALERSQRLAESSGERLDMVLTKLGLVSDGDMARTLARILGLPMAGPDDYPGSLILGGILSAQFLRHHHVLPVAESDDWVALAMTDPQDCYACQAVELASGRSVRPLVAVPAEIEAALDRLLGDGGGHLSRIVEELDGDHTSPNSGSGADDDVERLKDLASEAPVIRLVNLLIARAAEMRASDIHIEPFESRLAIRYRVDGLLVEAEQPPLRLKAALVSRIKIMARLNIAERRLPQDGRIKVAVRGRELDLRVSTLPTLHGESVVMRLLDREAATPDFGALGFEGAPLDTLLGLLRRPNGVVLVTGPTGSGKTTTLYTALLNLNSSDRMIVTVEDPVEYQLDGVNQIQVRPQIGLDFANVLRSILRQDPDVVMIGEIRDRQTAEIAIQAALTGHLVLSTLHTNSAAATATRLLDMGVEPYLLTATVTGLVAQRLVRRLCPSCRRAETPPAEVRAEFGLTMLWRPTGCPACGGTGYAGRIGLVEVLALDDRIRGLILRRATVQDLHEAARAAGMRAMFEDGLAKAETGATSLDEVLRVTREV